MPTAWVREYKANIRNFCLSSLKITLRQQKASVALRCHSSVGRLTCAPLIHIPMPGISHPQYWARNLEFIFEHKEPRASQARGGRCCPCCVSVASGKELLQHWESRRTALAAGGIPAQRDWPGWGHQLSWRRAAHAGGSGPGQRTSPGAGKLCGQSAQGSDFRLHCYGRMQYACNNSLILEATQWPTPSETRCRVIVSCQHETEQEHRTAGKMLGRLQCPWGILT